jgi:CRISPR-associated protein Cas4
MIKELINEFYGRKRKDKEKVAFWITDAGKCPRAVWFSRKGYPKKAYEARVMRIFEHGTHTHFRIMGVLYSIGLVTASEITIPENEMIHGRADAIVSLKGESYVVEIKSVNSAKFRKEEADLDHIKQLQLYLYFFKVKKGILLYENKDTQELQEYVIEYNDKLVKDVIASFNKLKDQIEKAIVPEIPKDIEEWRCNYCSYLEECKKIEEVKKEKNSD